MVREIKTLADAADWLERRSTRPEEIQWVSGIRQRIIDFVRQQQAQKPGFRTETARHDARGENPSQTTSETDRATSAS